MTHPDNFDIAAAQHGAVHCFEGDLGSFRQLEFNESKACGVGMTGYGGIWWDLVDRVCE